MTTTGESTEATDREATVGRLLERFDHVDPHLDKDVLDELYRRLPETARVPHSDAHGGMWLAMLHEDVVAVAGKPAVFSNAGGVTHPARGGDHARQIPNEFDPPEHTPYRKLFTDVLNVRLMKAAEPPLREITDQLLRDFMGGADTDFVSTVALRLPVKALGLVLGWDDDVAEEIFVHASGILSNFGSPDAMRIYYEDLGGVALRQVHDRRANPRDDYMTTLVQSTIDDRLLTDAELVNTIQAFILAGFETTAHAIANLMLCLAERPELQERIRTDADARSATIEEALRFFPPAHTMFRTVTEPATIGDSMVEEGDKVALLFAAANRDPNVFADPETFDIDRPNLRQHLSFGFGVHHCVGAPLARAEMRVLLEALAPLPPFELVGEPEYSPNLMLGQIIGVEVLPLRFRDAGAPGAA